MSESILIPPHPVKSRFLKSCELPENTAPPPFYLIIFGGAGDLSQKKLFPSLFRLFTEGSLPADFSITGVDRTHYSDQAYRDKLFDSLKKIETSDESKWNDFSAHIYHCDGDVTGDELYLALLAKLDTLHGIGSTCPQNLIFYMAVQPALMPLIVAGLGRNHLTRCRFTGRIVIEKPFGTDRKSAAELNASLREYFNENQIYRMDHYLGKETVQNISFFRFANSIFEPLWNSKYIDNVQITVAEDIGIEKRGDFYESSGVVRDIVQNHLLQLMALIAMEVPAGFEADLVRNEKAKIYTSIRPFSPERSADYVRGQYGPAVIDGMKINGYREEDKVSPRSNTPTFMAARLFIDNWRWAGVPFYVRAGKRLAKRTTRIVIQFKQVPLHLFGRSCDNPDPNLLVFSIQPEESISLFMGVKYPKSENRIYPAQMKINYAEAFGIKPFTSYERQLLDCMRGDLTLFARQDEIELMWQLVDPLITFWENTAPDFPDYAPFSWGPPAAELLPASNGHGWHIL